MFSSSDEQDDVGASERSPVTDHSDGEKRGEADSTEELAAKDVAGPHLSKNIDIEKRIKHVEEEKEDVSDDESDNEVDLSPVKAKLTYENCLKQKGQEFKCDKCDFVGKMELFIKKHKIQSIPRPSKCF